MVSLYFAIPMLAMARFAFQRIPVALLTPDHLFDSWTLKGLDDALGEAGLHHAAWISIQLAVLAVLVNLALLLPLAIAVELYYPQFKGPLTMITLLPWVIPPIALVVGIAATFRTLAPWFLSSPLSLVPFYALTAMPFTYRALDAGLQSIWRQDAERGGAEPRRPHDDDPVPRADPEPRRVADRLVGAHRRAGAGRVHVRRAAPQEHAADVHGQLPARCGPGRHRAGAGRDGPDVASCSGSSCA